MYFCPNFLLLAKKIQKTAWRGPKKIFFFFGFLKKSRPKLKILENPENFTIKIIFCARFVLYKLFCSSKQKKVMAKTKIWKSRLLSPVARTQGAVWQNEGDLGGFWVETNLLMKFRQNRSRTPDWPLWFSGADTLKASFLKAAWGVRQLMVAFRQLKWPAGQPWIY